MAEQPLSFTYAYVVELQPGCWLATWHGDPGRTEVLSYATQFKSHRSASRMLTMKMRHRPFPLAAVRRIRIVVEYARGADDV